VHKLLHYARKIGALANAAEGVVQFAVECVELFVNGLVFWLRTIAYRLERGHCLLRGTEMAVTNFPGRKDNRQDGVKYRTRHWDNLQRRFPVHVRWNNLLQLLAQNRFGSRLLW